MRPPKLWCDEETPGIQPGDYYCDCMGTWKIEPDLSWRPYHLLTPEELKEVSELSSHPTLPAIKVPQSEFDRQVIESIVDGSADMQTDNEGQILIYTGMYRQKDGTISDSPDPSYDEK